MPKTYGTVATFTAGSVLTAAQLNVASGAVNNLVLPPACRLLQAAVQTIPASTPTAIVYGNNEAYDTDGMHDVVTNNSRITIQTPGIYIITASIGLTSTPVSAFEFYLDLNNGTRLAEDNALGSSSYKSISVMVSLALSDYVESKLYIDGPRDTRQVSLPQVTHMAATWIGRTS